MSWKYLAYTGIVALFLCQGTLCRALEIAYTIDMPQPWTHYFHLQIDISDVESESIDVQMPAWSPGRYRIRNFARNVRDFTAHHDEKELEVQKQDKQTWRITTEGNSEVTVRYKVYANELAGDYSQLNDFHAFLDGASLYMYLVEHKANPVSLKIKKPDGWMILSSAGELGQTDFKFPNYDIMIDHLVQLGKFFLEEFTIGNTRYRVSILNNGERKPIDDFVEKVRKLQATAIDMFGPVEDQERYTFFFHFLPDSRTTAGMEHLDCCQLTRKHDLSDTGVSMDWTLWVTAHELVHTWNVKRLRPAGLGPFDYTKEVYTPLLWFAEGCTSYLANLIMLRSGIWSEVQFYQRVAENIRSFRSTPGIFHRSAEESSFDTWFWDEGGSYGEYDWNNVSVSYYLKGELIGLCMDLNIRRLTDNEKSFEDFFKLLYQRFYAQSEAENYYLKGQGYTTEDILKALEDTTGTLWNRFYQNLIASAGDINFEYFLSFADLVLEQDDEEQPPYTGLRVKYGNGGHPVVDWIEFESPAHQAGLSRHDVLIALDGERVFLNDFNKVLKRHAIDYEIQVTLLRDDRLLEKKMRLIEGWKAFYYSIRQADIPSRRGQVILKDWLDLPDISD